MFGYLKNSDITVRLSLNPFQWKWLPSVAYDPPTPFYPKRRTFALVFLFLQSFIDINDGTEDVHAFNKIFNQVMEGFEEDEQPDVGHPVSPLSKAHSDLE
jgi:hypothetical protein